MSKVTVDTSKPLEINDFAKLPDSAKTYFAENEEKKFVLNQEHKGIVDAYLSTYNIAIDTRNTLEKANKEAADHRVKLASLQAASKKFGVTYESVEEYEQNLGKLRDMSAEQAIKDAQDSRDNIKKQLEDTVAEKDKNIANLSESIRNERLSNVLEQELHRSGGSVELLQHIVKPHLDFYKEEGTENEIVVIRDPNTKAILRGDDQKPLPVSAYLERLKKDDRYKVAFKTIVAAGGGHSGNAGGGGGNRLNPQTASALELIREGLRKK